MRHFCNVGAFLYASLRRERCNPKSGSSQIALCTEQCAHFRVLSVCFLCLFLCPAKTGYRNTTSGQHTNHLGTRLHQNRFGFAALRFCINISSSVFRYKRLMKPGGKPAGLRYFKSSTHSLKRRMAQKKPTTDKLPRRSAAWPFYSRICVSNGRDLLLCTSYVDRLGRAHRLNSNGDTCELCLRIYICINNMRGSETVWLRSVLVLCFV